MTYYRAIELKEGELVQFVGCHVVSFPYGYATPTIGFVEDDSVDDLLEACKAASGAIEHRGKLALSSWNHLKGDESNWRDGVEPYLLDVYDQLAVAIAKAEGSDGKT